ncbi:IPT/TIG domain-containing protein [bacterium]|nr:IPT/TIG domain-containing protein [bacterium]
MKTIVKTVIIGLFVLTSTGAFAARPVITGLTKTNGPLSGGSYVGIIGENFTKATYFKFGDYRVITKRFVNSSLVYVMTVEHSQGNTTVKAYTSDERPSLPYNGFTYTNEGPELDSVNINNGPAEGNTIVHYYGRNFTPNMTIRFGENESIRRYFYHSDRMYSYTPLCDLDGETSKVVDIAVAVGDQQAYLDDAFTFQREKPVITKVWPASGIKQGGSLLQIWGTNFRATDRWYIGGKEIQFYIPNYHHEFKYGHSSYVLLKTEDAGELTVGEALDVTVEPVVEGVGSDTKSDAFTFTEDAPVFETVYPNKGFASGSTVYIKGKNISQDITTNFLKLASEDVSADINGGTTTYYYHDGLIRVKTPARGSTPPEGVLVDVRMENTNGYAYNYNGFFYQDLAPRIHYIYPNNGVVTGSQYVYIRGRNFTDDDMSVSFSTQPDPNIHRIYRSDLMAIKTNAALSAEATTVTVSSLANGATSLNGGYIYTENSPWIRSIWPLADTVLGNRNLYLYGENFTPASTVQFDGSDDPIAINYFYHSGAVRVKTPAHDEGKVDLTIGTEFGDPYTAEKAYRFHVAPPVYDPGTPIINYVSPLSGTRAGGAYVYLYGKDLTKDTKVTFNGQPANIIHVHPNGSRILILTPAVDYLGTVDIQTVNVVNNSSLDFTLEDGFNYTDDHPVITMINPAKGFVYGGTYVYLYGENLTKDVELRLGGKKAILQHFYHSRLARFITAPNDTASLVNLDVETQFGSKLLADAYHYAEFSPEVTAITPNHGNSDGGNWIRIYGSFLTPSTKVYVDNVLVPEDQVKYYHTRYLIAKAPANATDPYDYKTVDIKIETEYGTIVETDSYTYVKPGVQLSFQN